MTKPLLDLIPIFSQIRRNHGLEHATINTLSEKFQGMGMAGISGLNGFLLVADLPTETVTEIALDSLRRLKSGEKYLAIQQHCGTNLAATTLLVALIAFFAMAGTGRNSKLKWHRLPLAVMLAIPTYFLSKPVGPWLQKILTTSAFPEGMELTQVTSLRAFGRTIHSVTTRL